MSLTCPFDVAVVDNRGTEHSNLALRIGGITADIAARHGVRGVFEPTASLVDQGLTSMGMIDLMLAVEAEFAIEIPPCEMSPTNFYSKASLTEMLTRLLAVQSAMGSIHLSTSPRPAVG